MTDFRKSFLGFDTDVEKTKDGHYNLFLKFRGKRFAEFTTGPSNMGIVYRTASYEEPNHNLALYLGYGSLFLTLPWKNSDKKYKYGDDFDDEAPSYGGYLTDETTGFFDTLCYYKKDGLHFYDFPWKFETLDHLKYTKNNKWESNRNIDETDVKKFAEYPFEFTTKDGIVQTTTAQLSFEMYIHGCKWLNLKRRTYIVNVEFKDSVGNNIDSWKGGYSHICYHLTNQQKLIFEELGPEIAVSLIYKNFLNDVKNGRFNL